MPVLELMNWDKNKQRWYRMHQGQQITATWRTLGLPKAGYSRESSRLKANEYFKAEEARIDGTEARRQETIRTGLERIAEIDVSRATNDIVRDTLNMLAATGQLTTDRIAAIANVKSKVQNAFAEKKVPKTCTVDARLTEWLESKRIKRGGGKVRPKSWNNIRFLADYWRKHDFLKDMDASQINAQTVGKFKQWVDHVDLSDSQKAQHCLYFVAFVQWLYRIEVLDNVPRNLTDVSWTIRKANVKIIDIDVVKKLLKNVKNDFHRMVAYLVVNTGALNGDIGKMKKADIQGDIWTRKRGKTKDRKNTPTVSYRLWPETIALMKKYQSNHPELYLLSSTGTPLYIDDFQADGTPHIKDLLGMNWGRASYTLTLEELRKVPAQVIEDNEKYAEFTTLMLGNAPGDITKSHYAPESAKRFLECCDWLRTQILD